ncbi:unnamed protein product [Clonostachys rosea f. rosea IK726]|uniref:Protein BFR2 n=2 Tax=Bionectria ochroleuca TaxID=29856 RepID=A0A0B7JZZ2_BIOOC|nr:unnamed protein product [Clonostachys rosea f. rosea IK726]
MSGSKGRAKQFMDDEKIVKDYDPEADGRDVEESGSDASGDERTGTEHYEAVGKSKLRQKDSVFLGSEYRGSKVSRAALEDDEEDEDEDEEDEEDEEEQYDDPDLADLEADEANASDSEIESDDALAESDEERLKDFTFRGSSKPAKPSAKRATAADFMSPSEDGEDATGGVDLDDDESSDEALDEDELGSDESEDEDDGLEALADGLSDLGEDSEESEEEDPSDEDDENSEDDSSDDDGKSTKKKSAPGLVSQAPASQQQSEVEKGVAIQQQRKVYDGLLNLRIRLQKALVAVNTFPVIDDSEPATEPYEAAEVAAIKLLNTISNLKHDFGTTAQVGSKRKREIEISLSNDEIWEQLEDEERELMKSRQDRLEKWSRRVQSVTVTTAPKGLGARNKTLINNLEDQLADSDDRLVKKTRVPRSCAPAQAAKRVAEDEYIYDDADFYQLLLKELVEQRTVDTSGDQVNGVPAVMLTAAKDVKMRKNVDRKASKGRKMRFTVHEKLQNFMAPEDRRSWEQGAIDRFFVTLFGQKMELEEDESEDEDMQEVEAQAEGLRLFQ